MCLTTYDEKTQPNSIVEMEAAFRSMATGDLPIAFDADEARTLLGDMLLRCRMDLRHPGCWMLFSFRDFESGEDLRLTAMRWVIDLHACIPRGYPEPIGALQEGLRLVKRRLRPSAGMEAYLNAQAPKLAALEARQASIEPERLKRLLNHPRSMNDADTIRLPFAVTLPTAKVFEVLKDDCFALHRLGQGMETESAYHAALLKYRNLISTGVVNGIHVILAEPETAFVEPTTYVQHFRYVLDDRKWIDLVLARLLTQPEVSGPLHVEAQLLTVLSSLGGWDRTRLELLLSQKDLLARHPGEFQSAAANAIDHITRRDATVETWAVLTLLRMLRRCLDTRPDQLMEDQLRRCRAWVARSRRGHDLLWLDERLEELSSTDPEEPAQDEHPTEPLARRLVDDRALTRGTLLFLLSLPELGDFVRVTPLIENILSLSDEHRLLWKLAHGKDRLLLGRSGMFIRRIVAGRIEFRQRSNR